MNSNNVTNTAAFLQSLEHNYLLDDVRGRMADLITAKSRAGTAAKYGTHWAEAIEDHYINSLWSELGNLTPNDANRRATAYNSLRFTQPMDAGRVSDGGGEPCEFTADKVVDAYLGNDDLPQGCLFLIPVHELDRQLLPAIARHVYNIPLEGRALGDYSGLPAEKIKETTIYRYYAMRLILAQVLFTELLDEMPLLRVQRDRARAVAIAFAKPNQATVNFISDVFFKEVARSSDFMPNLVVNTLIGRDFYTD